MAKKTFTLPSLQLDKSLRVWSLDQLRAMDPNLLTSSQIDFGVPYVKIDLKKRTQLATL
jgi:hypothetical protein